MDMAPGVCYVNAGSNLFQQLTVRSTENRKRNEDDQKKLDVAKQLELVSNQYDLLR